MWSKAKSSKRLAKKLTCIILAALILTPASMAMARVDVDLLVTEDPVLVITGSDLPGGARGTAADLTNERAYTLEELRELEDLAAERVYSAISSFPQKIFYRGQGVDLQGLLALSGYDANGKIAALAPEGYRTVLDLGDERFSFPDFYDDSAEGAQPAGPMLAWKSAENRLEPPVPPEPFESPDEEADASSLRLFVGQKEVDEVTSPLLAKNVNKIVAGEALDEVVLTVLEDEYTRADVLLLPRAQNDYEIATQAGTRVDTVRGTPLSVLLEDVDNEAVIAFTTVDNYGRISEFTMTKGELVLGCAMLAYEVKGDDGWTAYLRNTDEGPGYFRLMVDGTSGAHAVNSIYIESPAGEPPSAWAQLEVLEALEAGLVPDSVANGGWENGTTRLSAAEAIVLLIEKASGSTMEEIALERGWNLQEGGFDDTDSAAVTFLKHAEVTQGVSADENKYAPDSLYNRAQAVTMIGRAAEVFFGQESQGENPYTDVPAWAAPYVGYAADTKITFGVGDGLFGSERTLENQMTAVFAIRAYKVWYSAI